MADAFASWIERQGNVAGVISAGGSGAASLVAPGMRTLPVGMPKLIISSVASGDVGALCRPRRHHDDVFGHRRAGPQLDLARSAVATAPMRIAGMVKARLDQREATGRAASAGLPSVGITMFGVTTPAVQKIAADLRDDFECLVFHATGVGGRSMEKLVDSGQLAGVIDLTTTEVCDLLMGGVFPATEDRFGAIIRTRLPYVGSVGALDMVNFGAPDTVPERYRGRKFHVHNPQVTLMRTTREENERMGRWIGERLNQMDGPVRFFLPEGGVSALDAPRPAVLGSRGRRRPVPRAGAHRAADRQPPTDPRQAEHQRSRVRLDHRQRVPNAVRPRRGAPETSEVTDGPV